MVVARPFSHSHIFTPSLLHQRSYTLHAPLHGQAFAGGQAFFDEGAVDDGVLGVREAWERLHCGTAAQNKWHTQVERRNLIEHAD